MIVGYHVIFGAYGFWLPNDPRGSWSDFVGSWELLRYGPATKTTERQSVAHREHDRGVRLAAKRRFCGRRWRSTVCRPVRSAGDSAGTLQSRGCPSGRAPFCRITSIS